MKFFFDNVNFQSNTGPNTFGSRLAKKIISLGHEITGPEECDVHLAFIEQTAQKNEKSVLVQRLDGIWFKPEEFVSMNSGIKRTYQSADFIVWQSNFDKTMIEKWWGKRKGKVIHNGIEINKRDVVDHRITTIRRAYKKMFICSASWHRQKRLKENIELFFKIKEKNPSSCLVIMGSNPDYVVRHNDIFYTGPISHETCLQMFSAADWMIHLAWLDHCPNVVIEALSQQCPVICTSSGGTSEIVRNNGLVIKENRDYQYVLLDYDDPYELSVRCPELPIIEIDDSYIDIEKVAQKYIQIYQEVE